MKRKRVLIAGVVVALAIGVWAIERGKRGNERRELGRILDGAGDFQQTLEECLFAGRPPLEWTLGATSAAVRQGDDWWAACGSAAVQTLDDARRSVAGINERARRHSTVLSHFSTHGSLPGGSASPLAPTPADICRAAAALRAEYASLLRDAGRDVGAFAPPSCDIDASRIPTIVPLRAPEPGMESLTWRVAAPGGWIAPGENGESLYRLRDETWQRVEVPDRSLVDVLRLAQGGEPALVLRGSPQRVVELEGERWVDVGEVPGGLSVQRLRHTASGLVLVAHEGTWPRARYFAVRPSGDGSFGDPIAVTGSLERPACQHGFREDGSIWMLCRSEADGLHILDAYVLPSGEPASTQQRVARRDDSSGAPPLQSCATGDATWALFGGGRFGEAEATLFASGATSGGDAAWRAKGRVAAGEGGLYCAGAELTWIGTLRGERGTWAVHCDVELGCGEPERIVAGFAPFYVADDGSTLVVPISPSTLDGGSPSALVFERGDDGYVASGFARVDGRPGLRDVWRFGEQLLERRP